ncbi:hypothetical protein CDAR_241711 [Caerostris darwini]|uniref:Uncharacterized protein n=1 Tax=Caerostris darwini TaxID=1538125 RepID=A0AAV4TAC4_9ARAC|nr:hypothetical protein CDAR_241711 [Caerostris darwini]
MSSVCLEGECLAHSRAAAVIQSDGNINPNQYPDRSPHRYWSSCINSVAHIQVIEYFVIDHHSDKMQCLHLNGFHLRLRWGVVLQRLQRKYDSFEMKFIEGFT